MTSLGNLGFVSAVLGMFFTSDLPPGRFDGAEVFRGDVFGSRETAEGFSVFWRLQCNEDGCGSFGWSGLERGAGSGG